MFRRQSFWCTPLATVLVMNFLLLLTSLASAATVDLPRTGQTTCYNQAGVVIDCSGTGQDGEYQNGIAWPDPRFTNNGDGTITDNLTGLTWLQDTECIGRIEWSDALGSVNVLANGSCGLTDGSVAGDWRMPNYFELMSISNLGVDNALPWLESFGFTNLQAYVYWSSTSLSGLYAHDKVYTYQFRDRFSSSTYKTFSYQTWPVKGVSSGPAKVLKTGQTNCFSDTGDEIACAGTGQDGEHQAGAPLPDPRFVDNTDGTVTDNLTGLTWLQDTNCFGGRAWESALSDANGLADGACGLTDGSTAGSWRLPNALEIISLSDYSQPYPMLSAGHPFTNLTYNNHWSSTTRPGLSWTTNSYTDGWQSGGRLVDSPKSLDSFIVVWPVRDSSADDTCKLVTVSDATSSEASYEACERLVMDAFLAEDGATVSLSSGEEIRIKPDFLIENGATMSARVCGQSLCETSASPMPDGCHPCVELICDSYPGCCEVEFSQACLDKVDTVCGLVCE